MIHESCRTHLDMPSMSSLGHLEVKKKNLVHLVLDLFFGHLHQYDSFHNLSLHHCRTRAGKISIYELHLHVVNLIELLIRFAKI